MAAGKSMQAFILEHRVELDAAINAVTYRHNGNGGRGRVPTPAPAYSDKTRHGWILSHEDLYWWAKSEGVKIWCSRSTSSN